MQTFDIALDPNEVKDYAYDWSGGLETGETIASQVVTFVDAAGTTSPQNSASDTVSRVFLTGGTPGGRVVFTIRATTSAGRVLEEAFAVNVVESTYEPPVETDVQRLTREIAEAKSQRALVATGNAVVDVWRDGRRIRKAVPTLTALNSYIRQLEGELYTAQIAAGLSVAPPRRAIELNWSN